MRESIGRRLGIVKISPMLAEDLQIALYKMLWVQDKVYQFYCDRIMLVASHTEFDPLEDGELIPEYKVIVTHLDHIHFQGDFMYLERMEDNESGIRRAGK